MRKFFHLGIILGLFLGGALPAYAQGQAFADLYPADTSGFPAVSALLDVFDERGSFATGLQREAVTVIEDGQPIAPEELTEQALPAQLVVSINSGPALDVRDGQGISRFQRLVQVLDGWAQSLSTDMPDDLSLVSISGPVVSHANPNDFRSSLRSFAPDFRSTTPNLQSLTLALDIAGMQSARQGMKRAVLFITPHMDDTNLAANLQPLIERAVQSKIRVFVWFVDLDVYFTTTSAAAFNMLATQTGGSLFAFSGKEAFPNPESYFAPLRRTYTLKYESAIKTGGEHSLAVEVALPAGKITSAQQTLNIDLQPPNPILVAPPLQITRQAPETDPFNTKLLVPELQTLKIIIEYPDGHRRPLRRTTLYVDGQIVDENTAEPFDTFTWDLKGYQLSGEHQVMVEAVDSTGMSKAGMPLPITVTVVQPPRGMAAVIAKYRLPIIIGAMSMAGLALVLILLTGRLKLPSLRARRKTQEAQRDPLTQPVTVNAEPPTSPHERVRRKKEAAANTRTRLVEASATLVNLAPDGQPTTRNPIPLVEKETVLGTDPVQCTEVLDDPSIAPIHARLRMTGAGEYILIDNGSVGGTWVNYEPVSREGRRLESGDMVHFGQLIYRFQLREPPPVPEPSVVTEKPVE